MQRSDNIAILGAGPIGSVLAIMLARKGYNVEIYERRQNPAKGIDHSQKQINFGVSMRGVQAFQLIQVWDKIEKHSIPMYSRTYHNRNGTVRHHQYGKRNESIHSIRSELLTNLLIKQYDQYDNIKITYDTYIQEIDIEKSQITFFNDNGETNAKEFKQIFMTNDSFKIIKKQLVFLKDFVFNQDYSNYGYIETQIPATSQNEFAFNQNSFHIWTNDDIHIIAMPNKNKTFSCNLFLPLQGEISFDTIKSIEELNKFMHGYFPELADHMIYNDDALNPDKVGRLYDHTCYPWVFNNLCLFGNAAHQIFPYFGQGLNSALEDCTILNELIEKHSGDWQVITQDFQKLRKPNTDSINELAKQNFKTLKYQMYDDDFQEKKQIINYLSDNYEELFMSQAQLIEFSNVDFKKTQTFAKVEEEIIKQIRMIPNYEKIIEANKKDSIIRQILKSFVGKYDVESTAVEIINQLGVLSKNQEVILLPNIGQFEIAPIQNCSIIGDTSFNEQIQQFSQFQGAATRARFNSDKRYPKYFNETILGLCLNITGSEEGIIDLKLINEAYDKAILKSIQQSMKNISNIYKVAILKVNKLDTNIIRLSQEALSYIEEKGFQVIAVNGQLLNGSDEDLYLQKFLLTEDNIIVEMVDLEQIDRGAYIVNVESSITKSNVTPASFKTRKILNAELLDIYAHKRREVYYSEYLAVEELISLMRNRTEYIEEKLFIRVHQINELCMQQSIITLEELIKIFKTKQVIENLQTIEEYIHQVLRFFIVQKETNFVLCNMNTRNFVHGFRHHLGTASGVQSCQFYIMQILLGLSKDRHILYDPVKLLHLKEYDIQKIKTYQNHDSLFKVIQDWLLDFYNEEQEVRKIGNAPHIDDILQGCKDFSREVAITVIYLLNNPGCFQSKIVDYVLKFEDSFLTFLDSHIVLVDHHLGNKRGTGQSSGGKYLRESKMSQIIWRDIYHLQTHAKSVLDWQNQMKLSSQQQLQSSAEDIVNYLNSVQQSENLIDLTRSDSLTRSKTIIRNIIKDQLTQNFDDHSDNFSSNNYKIETPLITKLDISKRYEKFDTNIDYKSIILNNSSEKSIAITLRNFLNKGDNIIVLTPCSHVLHTLEKKYQIDIRYLNVFEEAKLEFAEERLRQIVDKNTKAVYIPNYSELVGQDLNQVQLSIIQEVCNYHKLFIIYDEKSYFTSQHTTLHILQMSLQIPTLILSGIPISQNMREFEVGWVIPVNTLGYFDNILTKKNVEKYEKNLSLTALNCLPQILDQLNDLRKERFNESKIQFSANIAERINKINGLSTVSPIQPQNLIIHINLPSFKDIEDDVLFSKLLLDKFGVKILPSQTLLQPNKLLVILDQEESVIIQSIERLEEFCLRYQLVKQ